MPKIYESRHKRFSCWGVFALPLTFTLYGCATHECNVNNTSTPVSWLTRGYPAVSDTVKQGCTESTVAGVVYGSDTYRPKITREKQDNVTSPQDSICDQNAESLKYDRAEAAASEVIGCTVGKALTNRRSSSATSYEFYDNEIKVTRNLNRELANVNSHMVFLIAEHRKVSAATQEQELSAMQKREYEQQARDESRIFLRADLSWAQNQLGVSEENLMSQTQVVCDNSLGDIGEVQAVRLHAELQSLETHVSSLTREILYLRQINDTLEEFRSQ